MFNLQTYNQEMEKSFDKQFEGELWVGYRKENETKEDLEDYYNRTELLDFLTSSHTQLLKQFLEGEAERLKVILPKDCNNCRNCINCVDDYTIGLHKSISDQITHYQSLLSTLGYN